MRARICGSFATVRHAMAASAAATALLLTACAQPPHPVGLAEVLDRPAEHALLADLRAYDDGQYGDAEKALNTAMAAGLASARDRASADKLLAFIYCTSDRMAECEAAFRSAIEADPSFLLSRSESGHPIWGPVYRRVVMSTH